MIQCDVAIVGAGPAGSVAAQRLASAGIRVVMLEKEKFPRDKTCGDLVAARGLSVLERSGLKDWASQFMTVGTMRFSAPDGQILDVPQEQSGPAIGGRLIPRRVLDNRLAQHAVESGATLIEETPIRKVQVTDRRVRLSGNGVEISARMTILAEGSNTALSRSLGLAQGQADLLAMRQYFIGDAGPANLLEFHFQKNIIPGYSWCFGVGNDHINIGTGTYTHRVRSHQINLQKELERFTSDPILGERLKRAEPAGPVKGHPLRTSVADTRTHAAHLLVAGDSAGLVSPFTGEGIAAALVSGELAAAAAQSALAATDFSETTLSIYSKALRHHYQADQQAGRILRAVLKFPPILNRVFRNMRQDSTLAKLFTDVYLDKLSPWLLLKPENLFRFLL